MHNIAIAEDERDFADMYATMLGSYLKEQNIEFNIDIYTESTKLADCKTGYDIYFLDVQMPKLNGLDLANAIRRSAGNNAKIVFVTSDENAVFDAFDVDAFGFIRKTNLKEDFLKTMQKYAAWLASRQCVYRFASDMGEIVKAENEIIYADAYGHRLYLHCTDGDYRIYGTLSEAAEKLCDAYFIQPYKGYLVNCRYIGCVGAKELTLNAECEITIPVSRHRLDTVRDEFFKYKSIEAENR